MTYVVSLTKRAGIYVRISSGPEGTRLGVTRQLDGFRAKASSMGWSLVQVASSSTSQIARACPWPAGGDVDPPTTVWENTQATRGFNSTSACTPWPTASIDATGMRRSGPER